MDKTFRKILFWVLGIVFGLPVTLYVTIVAVNWRDQPPSPLVQQLTEQIRAAPSVISDDNGYIDLMGFDVAPGEDVRAMGIRRIAWIDRVNEVGFK